jgi:hypothetical protein
MIESLNSIAFRAMIFENPYVLQLPSSLMLRARHARFDNAKEVTMQFSPLRMSLVACRAFMGPMSDIEPFRFMFFS